VKTNMVHTLHQVKAEGSQPLESFRDLLTKDGIQKVFSKPKQSYCMWNGEQGF
jgi:hypothetical protein